MSQIDVQPSGDSSFSYLDLSAFRPLFVDPKNPERMNFYVSGMRCAKCVNRIESLAGQISSIEGLRVDISKNSVEVQLKDSAQSFGQVAEHIENLGFKVKPLQSAESDRQQAMIQKHQDRLEVMRLGVAGYAAAQIMSFAFANYLGAPDEFKLVFNWISFLLYLPVLGFSAQPFYQGFWQAIKTKSLSIDGPIAIASVSGFVFSTWNLILGKDGIYFDSLSGFLFLILCSRAVQKRMVRNFLSSDIDLQSQIGDRILNTATGQWIPIQAIQEKQSYHLQSGQILPMDSQVQSEQGIFSLAFLSGESRPKSFRKGGFVPSGAMCLQDVVIQSLKIPRDSSYAKMLQEIKSLSLAKTKIQETADTWSKWLLIIVFSSAILFLVGYSFVDVHQALERSLALIILACPCAMAFGTPLALAFSVRKAARNGFLVKNSDVFERLTQVKNIFIDKTGTLTDSKLKIEKHQFLMDSLSKSDQDYYMSLSFAMEQKSVHPVSFAIREYLNNWSSANISIDKLEEVPGIGIKAVVGGDQYCLKATHRDSASKVVSLYKIDAGSVWTEILAFYFFDEMILGGSESIQKLKDLGYQVFILSGDQKSAVESTALRLGVSSEQVFAQLSPEQKIQKIQSTSGYSLMIGDGVNDGLALAAAHVGIAVSGSVDVAFKTASVYMTKPGIGLLPVLLEDSQDALNLVRRNLYISVIYNFAGGAAALFGLVNPFVAAILMPISSSFILLSSWLGSRDSRISDSNGGL